MRYEEGKIPADYKCAKCGISGVKLWRQYQTFLNHIELHCCDCAAKDQGRDISDIDQDGRSTSETETRSDSIGWLIPAVPTEDESTYWGYSSVPTLGMLWWRYLPLQLGTPTLTMSIDMLLMAIQKDLGAIAEISPITESICAGVEDAVKRLATQARSSK